MTGDKPRVIDMAEERIVETPGLSEAVRELVAEALAHEDDAPSAKPSDRELDWSDPRWLDRDRWIELSNEGLLVKYFEQEADHEAEVRRLVDAWGDVEDGKLARRPAVELAASGERVEFSASAEQRLEAQLEAWEKQSG